MSKQGRDLMLFFTVLLLVTLIFFVAGFFMREEESEKKASDQAEVESIDPATAPQFITSPPTEVVAGESFYYLVKISDPDTKLENVTLRLVEGPEWLKRKGEFAVEGVAQVGDSNVEKIVLEAYDGQLKTTQSFYLLVKEK